MKTTMKRFYLANAIAVLILICFNGIQAQTTQSNLNQVELTKQFLGTWERQPSQDTIRTIEFKSFGFGLIYTSKTKANEKIISEGMSIMGYDNVNDKMFQCLIFNTSPNVYNYAWWFTSPTKFTVINYADLKDPEKASFIGKGELVSSDMFVENHYINGKVIETTSWHRINK